MNNAMPQKIAEHELLQKIADQVERIEKSLVPAGTQEWFSIKQAAVVVGLSPDHIRRAVTGNTLPCSNVGTNDRPLYRISKTDLDTFMQTRKSGALPPTKKKRGLPHSPFIRASRMARMQAAE